MAQQFLAFITGPEGQEMPTNEQGEICVQTPALMSGFADGKGVEMASGVDAVLGEVASLDSRVREVRDRQQQLIAELERLQQQLREQREDRTEFLHRHDGPLLMFSRAAARLVVCLPAFRV